MPSQYNFAPLNPRELADFGFERVRGAAFNAVRQLWRRRQAGGMLQKDLAASIDRDPAWVSKNLNGPGNWTMRTFGELVSALGGEVEISVRALEDPIDTPTNYDAYLEAEPEAKSFVYPPGAGTSEPPSTTFVRT